MIKKELNDNLLQIKGVKDYQLHHENRMYNPILPGLKDEYWRVLSDGGEIKWVSDDFVLLERMSIVFHYIGSVKRLEHKFNDTILGFQSFRNINGEVNERVKRSIRITLLDGYNNVEKYTNEVLKRIEDLVNDERKK
jgi:hypothetical protein